MIQIHKTKILSFPELSESISEKVQVRANFDVWLATFLRNMAWTSSSACEIFEREIRL